MKISSRIALLINGVSCLQTKLSDREGHKARRVGPQAIPLDQNIKSGHGTREPGVEIRPGPVHDFLQMADHGQHRQDRLHQDTILPLPRRHSLRLAGSPSAAWKVVSLKTIIRSANRRMSP